MKIFCQAILFLILLAAGSRAGEAPKKLHVLFIGNSLTSYHNLPAIIASLAAASGRELTYGSSLVGGAALEKHWDEGKALAKIKAEKWDDVVLQDFSAEAFTKRETMFRYGHLFDAEIRQAGAKTVLYMTWALENAPEKFPVIADAYMSLGKELKATVAPVGLAWQALLGSETKSAISLYLPDHKHPTPAGSYLAACVFYRTLFGVPSATVPPEVPGQNVTKDEALTLQRVADAVVLPVAEAP